jgi:hypothetical protein
MQPPDLKSQRAQNFQFSNNETPRINHFGCSAAQFFGAWICVIALLATSTFGQTPISQTNSPHRYLLIVDTSLSMRSRSDTTRAIVENLLLSGMNGEVQRGDSLGVWTFNERLYTGQLPLQRWMPGANAMIAGNTLEFLKKQRYEKSTDLSQVLPPMFDVVTNSARLTIILISDGDEKMRGTPFDAQINSIYGLSRKPLRKARIPFTTVLRADRGNIVGYTVNTGVPPINFPPLPARPEIAQQPKAVQPKAAPPIAPMIFSGKKTNSVVSTPSPIAETKALVPATNIVAKTEPAPTAPASVTTTVVPLSSTRETNKELPVNTQTPIVRTAAVASAVTAVVPPPEKPKAEISSNAVAIAAPEPQKNLSSKAESSVSVAAPSADKALVDSPKLKAIPGEMQASQSVAQATRFATQATSPKLPSTGQLATTVPSQRAKSFPIWPIALGAILFLSAFLLLAVRRSRTSSNGSLITRSLEQEKK